MWKISLPTILYRSAEIQCLLPPPQEPDPRSQHGHRIVPVVIKILLP